MSFELDASKRETRILTVAQTFLESVQACLQEHKQQARTIDELEAEIDAWSRSHAQLSSDLLSLRLQQAKEQSQDLVLVLINANSFNFNTNLVAAGNEGGVEAATILNKEIEDYVALQNSAQDGRKTSSRVVLHLYIDKKDLFHVYETHSHIPVDQIKAFLSGFEQKWPTWSILSVENENEACRKAKALVLLYADISACSRIFLGGFDNMLKDKPKIVALYDSYLTPPGAQACLRVSSVFGDIAVHSPAYSEQATPVGTPSPSKSSFSLAHKAQGSGDSGSERSYSSTVLSQGPFPPLPPPSPSTPLKTRDANTIETAPKRACAHDRAKSAPAPSATNNASADTTLVPPGTKFYRNGNGKKVLDPAIPFYRQKPPLCNRFYLTREGCTNEKQCTFSHEYRLNKQQLEALAVDSRKSPCTHLLSHRKCPLGADLCHMGHFCPNKSSCPFRKDGKCKFFLPGMHDNEDKENEHEKAPAQKSGKSAFVIASD